MLPDYADIRSRIDEEPRWFDGTGVPRYDPFEPRMLGVYDHFAIYARIECQSCRKLFEVGEGWPRIDMYRLMRNQEPRNNIEALAESFHYGDPPRHGGCGGETMQSDPLEILEAWEGDKRRHDLEGPITEGDEPS